MALLAAGTATSAQALNPANSSGIYFTELMFTSTNSYKYIEITNLGASEVNLGGWGFDNSSRGGDPNDEGLPKTGLTDLSGIGLLQPGRSAIVTTACPIFACTNGSGEWLSSDVQGNDPFPNYWKYDFTGGPAQDTLNGETRVAPHANAPLLVNVQIIGVFDGNVAGLGSTNELNLYDASGNLVDRLTYTFASTPSGRSRQPLNDGVLGMNDASQWVMSAENDTFGSYRSLNSGGSFIEVGRPGVYVSIPVVPVPEPGTYAMMLAGLGLIGLVVRRRMSA